MNEISFPEKRVWLWGHPRCRSTAIERSMMERKDMTVIEPSEPFINLYYNGPERRTDRNLHANTAQEPSRLTEIVRLMLQKVTTPYVFSKNMGYYIAGRQRAKSTRRLLENGVNTFIIRDPRAALPSHYRQDSDFTDEEAGYGKLRQVFEYVTGALDQPPIVIEGDQFCSNPEAMMRAYCLKIGIPFSPESMTWKAGEVQAFEGYGQWTEAAEQSTGFQQPPNAFPDLSTFPTRVAKLVDKCRVHYEYLLNFAMKPDDA